MLELQAQSKTPFGDYYNLGRKAKVIFLDGACMSSSKIRVLLTLGIVCMTGITILMVVLKLNEQRPTVQLPEQEQFIVPTQKIPAIVDEFNNINSQITGFEEKSVSVKIWENGMRFRITGSMYAENPNRFRMKVWSALGAEMDIGSNDELFWYWSRRDRHPGLYYAVYEDYQKTRLKTPFNPVFMRESLGLSQIDPTNAKIGENEKQIMLTWPRMNASNQSVLYSMFLNKSSKRMDGIVISDLSGTTIASCQVEYEGLLPKRILYDWQEEQRSLVLEFSRPMINQQIPPDHWNMPRYSPKIDMGKD